MALLVISCVAAKPDELCPHCGRPMRVGAPECEYRCRQSREQPKQERMPPPSLITGLGPEEGSSIYPAAERLPPRRWYVKKKPRGRIEGLEKYRNRNREGMFADLPPMVRREAEHWLWKLCKPWRERRSLHAWLYPILCGQARRLARMTPEERSQWGHSMLAKRGGLAVQRKYRREGRNPTAKATHMSKCIRRDRKRKREQEEERKRLGLPEPPRHGFAVGCNPWED